MGAEQQYEQDKTKQQAVASGKLGPGGWIGLGRERTVVRTEAAGSSSFSGAWHGAFCALLCTIGRLIFFTSSRALLAMEFGSNVGPSWHGDAWPF